MSNRSTSAATAVHGVAYGRMSLFRLLVHIVHKSDRAALREFHNERTPVRLRKGPPMRVVESVETLCRTRKALRWVGYDQGALESAYDLTIDKFSHLPHVHRNGAGLPSRGNGPDCRYYFASVLQHVDEWRDAHPDANALQEEDTVARILQGCVLRNFRFSCMEAKRHCNPARFRYSYRADGRVIHLLMPGWMSGRDCGVWLTANLAGVDLSGADARGRAQAIVDSRLPIPRRVPLVHEMGRASPISPTVPAPDAHVEESITNHGLAHVVAKEKADDINHQRPSIQAIGPAALERLVTRVFDALEEGTYEAKVLADAFGLSRATFSRFAGSRWKTSLSERPPDLWANVAQTLAGHTAFTEAAEEAGVWAQVQDVLNRSHREKNADA